MKKPISLLIHCGIFFSRFLSPCIRSSVKKKLQFLVPGSKVAQRTP